jgi:broad specificity phosphatase PhoE
MSVTTIYLGVLEGLHTWEVRDESGELIGTNQSADLTPAVPESVSARQIRLWLVRHGISLAAVDAAIDAIPDQLQRDSVRVEWDYAPYVERTHPMLVPLAAALGLTEQQVDQAFVEAATV